MKDSYIHPSCCLEDGVKIGEGTSISAFCSIRNNTRIGNNTKIDVGVCIGANVKIGDNCHICGKVTICDETEVQDGVILGEFCTITNDMGIRSIERPTDERTIIEHGVIAEPRVIIRSGCTVGRGSRLRLGTIVTSDISAGTIVK